jgi:hypothetical protein
MVLVQISSSSAPPASSVRAASVIRAVRRPVALVLQLSISAK